MKKILLAIAPAIFVLGCSTTDPVTGEVDRNNRAIGSAVGAVSGALLGAAVGDGEGALIGAAVGGAAGFGVGHVMDKQEEDFRAKLQHEREQHAIEIQRLKEDTLRLTLNEGVSFDVNSAQIKPSFYVSLDKLASVLAEYNNSTVTIIGHTDSTGSASYNQQLSERRAQSVSTYLASRGISSARINTQGAGESQPRADNSTAAGRSSNRRVEMLVQQHASAGQTAPAS